MKDKIEETESFSGKAEYYQIGRADYSIAIYNIFREMNIKGNTTIADIGAGTGIFSKMLLATDAIVYSIEPNNDMFAVLQENLKKYSRSFLVHATAENTMLPNQSIDIITAAQSFHWFSPVKFKSECMRILKKNGKILLLWNVHRDTPLLKEIEMCMGTFNTHFHGFNTGINFEAIQYCIPDVQQLIYPHDLEYTRETFKYRWLSSSFAPNNTSKKYELFLQQLDKIYNKYALDDIVKIKNDTYIYVGSPFT